ncbi:MAG TPA: prolyl oligopeptidase family serine peptidase [Planctomycetota bacterium]|nr:prolyl oligopeptidase family serine peptidase [Planctomycetota bacterium]
MLCLIFAAAFGPFLPQESSASVQLPEELVPREWLVLPGMDRRGRRPFRPDAVFLRYLLDPDADAPVAGEQVEPGELERAGTWTARRADESGRLSREEAAWAYTALEVPVGGVMMANLQGASRLFVNGVGVVGDPYGYGKRGVPVALRAGRNDLFISGMRSDPRLRLWRPAAGLFFAGWDTTAPDVVQGRPGVAELAALLVYARDEVLPTPPLLVLEDTAGGSRVQCSLPFPLAPLTIAKPPLALVLDGEGEVKLALSAGEDEPLEIHLARVAPDDLRTVTFRSSIDDSIQRFAVRPARGARRAGLEMGLVLSLHGAGVQCRNQAASYGTYPDLWVVAPTNRRPFGFDWQDWGRRDAYEVLDRALALSGAHSDRCYLTGHSMGGHGVWHLAANDPDRWAAIAPSAGWESFDSYGRRPDGELADLWQAADGASRTLRLTDNLVGLPTFVLHGEADDNVPPSEARSMLAALEAAGGEPRSHFAQGRGHWWDGDAAPGADCLTWPGIFELFAEERRRAVPSEVSFTTIGPGVDAEHFGLRVEQLVHWGRPGRARAWPLADEQALALELDNVGCLGLSARWTAGISRLRVGESELELPAGTGPLWLRLEEGIWSASRSGPPAAEKHAGRTGPFKKAFDRRFLIVYATAGTEAETQASLSRARSDAQAWWYRANGHAWVVSDRDFLAIGAAYPERVRDRNVILYGNADSNAAWAVLLPDACPVGARRGAISIGERRWEGDDLACLFVYPRRGDPGSLVGVFADSGVRGARLGYTFLTFVSGAGFPDLSLVSARVLSEGDGGVLAAGWFDRTWSWQGGELERAR